jgi:hypothetical protein
VRSAVFFALFVIALDAHATDPSIRTLVAVAGNGTISVQLELSHAFDSDEFQRNLQSGLPTGFTYHVELIRKRPNWFDDTIASATLESIATWNARTREYLVNHRRDGKLLRSETFSTAEEVRKSLTTISDPAFFPRGGRPAHKLIVRARADITRRVIFYIVPSTISTPWKQTRVGTAATSNGRQK